MKRWNFELRDRPKEILKSLEYRLDKIGGFSFNQEKSTGFSFRKRILYPWYFAFQNWTIVTGELSENTINNHTTVNIFFSQHFLIRVIIYTSMISGIALLFVTVSLAKENSTFYILGGIFFALGTILWIALQRKFQKDIKKYKSLITDILEL